MPAHKSALNGEARPREQLVTGTASTFRGLLLTTNRSSNDVEDDKGRARARR